MAVPALAAVMTTPRVSRDTFPFSVFSLKIQCIIVPPSLFSDELESGPQASSVCNSTVLIDSDNDTEEYDDMDIEVVSEHINVKIVKENLRQKGE